MVALVTILRSETDQ